MALRRIPQIAIAAILCAINWWLYCGPRTMFETVGFAWSEFVASAGFALIFSIPITAVLMALVLLVVGDGGPSPRSWALWLVAAWLLGCIGGEAWVSYDEEVFRREVAAQSPPAAQNRARMWPNESGALLYHPERGVWATD